MDWPTSTTAERLEYVRKSAAAGFSIKHAADAANAPKNSIIGCAHRNKIKFGGSNRQANVTLMAAKMSGKKTKVHATPPRPLAPAQDGALATMASLRIGICHFPMFATPQDVKNPMLLPYCGRETDTRGEGEKAKDVLRVEWYCACHRRSMFRDR